MHLLVLCFASLFSLTISAQKYFLFIGTYTGSGSKGIYVYEFDAATGKAKWISNTDSVVNPSYLALSPDGNTLYACTETRTVNAGGISAFRFNKQTGELSFVNKQSSGGDNPAYVAVHPNGKWVTAGNYSGGSLAAFPVKKNGGVAPYSQLIQHTGKGINEQRQEMAHVHATVFSPKGDYLFTPDLGIDKVMAYRFTPTTKKPLASAATPFASTTPGSGPRHLDFHPNGKWAYLMEEMAGTVVAYNYSNGKLTSFQQIPSHADTATGEFGSADIHVSPDGKFLYASNRGTENNIAIFKINATNGTLSSVGYQSTLGMTPRNFCIDPGGKYLLIANQNTDNIVIFNRNTTTGLLAPTGKQLQIPRPVCLKMRVKR